VERPSHGRWLAVRFGNNIQYWNSDTWTPSTSVTDHREIFSAKDGAWSPDGSLLATVWDNRTLRVHDGADWAIRTEIRLDGELNGCAWMTNDRLVAIGGHGVYWFTYVSSRTCHAEPRNQNGACRCHDLAAGCDPPSSLANSWSAPRRQTYHRQPSSPVREAYMSRRANDTLR
jgi:WD40 repeat protein